MDTEAEARVLSYHMEAVNTVGRSHLSFIKGLIYHLSNGRLHSFQGSIPVYSSLQIQSACHKHLQITLEVECDS